MRIQDSGITGASGATGAPETQRTGRSGAASQSGGSRSDRVEISGAAGTIARALSANTSERAARVRQLAVEYQSGNFRPDAAATSRGMVADALARA